MMLIVACGIVLFRKIQEKALAPLCFSRSISCWHNSEDASFVVFGRQGEKLNLVAILPMKNQ